MSKFAAMTHYRGRFAPSPTGDLHFGSLLAAIVSYCEARSHHGEWLVRIEDVDSTRAVKGADKSILQTLENYALDWDGPIIYQSAESQQTSYQRALQTLSQKDLVYPCGCSRKDIAQATTYPGHCRITPPPANKPTSIRLIAENKGFTFTDDFQGLQQQNIQQQCGDFNIKRKDGLFCYQLAVVVDDALSKINHVVRGIDIMESTARQIYLQQLLDFPTPNYGHFPVVTNQDGAKLSKQNHATSISHEDPYQVTSAALRLLKQTLPKKPLNNQKALMQWAVEHWQTEPLKSMSQLTIR